MIVYRLNLINLIKLDKEEPANRCWYKLILLPRTIIQTTINDLVENPDCGEWDISSTENSVFIGDIIN